MAKFPNPYGPQALTVQEATNITAQRRVIRVTPTLDTSAYADDDVLFDSTEIPNAVLVPGGCSMLRFVGTVTYHNTVIPDALEIVFTQNQANLGTINDVAGSGSLWTDDLARAAKVLGLLKYDHTDNDVNLVNSHISAASGNDQAAGGILLPLMLQASGDSTSVYFSAITRDGAGLDSLAADSLEFIFHIDY